MFDLRRTPVLKVLVPFGAGSLAGYEWGFHLPVMAILIPCLIGWLILFILFLAGCSQRRITSILFAAFALFLFLFLGYGTGMFTRPVDPGLPVGEKVLIRGLVLEDPYAGKPGWKMVMRITRVITREETYEVDTRLIAYLDMPADSILPAAGETWELYGELANVRNSGNPGDVDYEAIMQRKNCWYRFYPDRRYSLNRKAIGPREGNLSAVRIRTLLSAQWKGDPQVVALLRAICLGDRSGLTDDIRQSYSDAGGMHLLALSGLHVGLIWWVLQHALAWLVRLLKKEAYRSVTIVVLLWYYAFITGFSASVCRSVTMFSLFTIARLIDQRTHPVNGILLSALLLILVNPGKLLDVGFQLSYVAILGIVTLFPVLRKTWKVKYRMLKWIWDATSVSMAAQLSTAPLVVFYFHKFPVYSLLTNLMAIPLLSVLITIFVVSIPFMASGLFTGVFNAVMIQMGNIMNKSMELVASIPGAVVEELYLHHVSLVMVMLFILMGMSMALCRSNFKGFGMMLIASSLLLWNSWTIYRCRQTAEMVIAHFNGCTHVTFREGLSVDHYCRGRDSLSIGYMDRYQSMNWQTRRYNSHTFFLHDSCQVRGKVSGSRRVSPGVLLIGNDQCNGYLILSKASPADFEVLFSQPGDFLLLSGEPWLPDSALFSIPVRCDLIADGSNRNPYIQLLDQRKVSAHSTRFEGAYLKQW